MGTSPSSFTTILMGKREMVASILLSFGRLVTVNALCLFNTIRLVCLQFVIVVFLDHTYFLISKFCTIITV